MSGRKLAELAIFVRCRLHLVGLSGTCSHSEQILMFYAFPERNYVARGLCLATGVSISRSNVNTILSTEEGNLLRQNQGYQSTTSIRTWLDILLHQLLSF